MSLRAEPDRSRIAPMKMNIGIDASTGSLATPPHMRSTMSDRPINLKVPSPDFLRVDRRRNGKMGQGDPRGEHQIRLIPA